MIAVGEGRTVRTLKELSAQSRGAATQDFLQDLALSLRQGRAELLAVLRRPALEQLMNGEDSPTVAGVRAHQRSPMNSSRSF